MHVGSRFALLWVFAFYGCGDEHAHATDAAEDHVHADASDPDVAAPDVAPTDASNAVEVRFAAKVGAEPFRCTMRYTGLGTMAATWVPLDFRLYVHNVRLVTAAGQEVPLTLTQDGTFQTENVALLDFEDRSGTCSNGNTLTNTVVRGTLPAGAAGPYNGVRFTLGVPFALNHANAAVARSPLNLTSLWWSWQGGYKFIRLDGRIEDAAGTVRVPSWNVHVGSTGCNGSAAGGVTMCANPNLGEVSLTGFDPTRNTVVADVARLFGGTNVSVSNAPSPGCMSDANDVDCMGVFPALGVPYGGAPAAQTFFRVE